MKVIIDGSYMAMRARFNVTGKLARSDGRRHGVIKGFLRSLGYTLRTLGASHFHTIVVWDGGKSQYRTALYPEYKIKEQTPEEIEEGKLYREQVAILQRDFLPALGVRSGYIQAVEADDLISVLASSNMNPPAVIVSSDTDFHQLVSDNIFLFGSDSKILRLPEIAARWGTTGDGCAIAKALIGDDSDKIKGVAGIGESRAKTLAPYFPHLLKKLREYQNGFPDTEWEVSGFEGKKFFEQLKMGLPILDRNLKLVRLPTYATDQHFPDKAAYYDFVTTVSNQFWERDTMKFATLCRIWEMDDIISEVAGAM